MNVLFIILLLLFAAAGIYVFLISPRLVGRPDTSVLKGWHYAHRGLHDNASDAPENSLRAIEKAVESGYGIEFDVQLSKDGIPVVFHDATLKRVCGVDGNVWDYTLEELQTLRLADSDQTIPTFEQVLKTVAGKVPLIIEYKLDVVSTKVCRLANEQLKEYKGVYCIECFHPLAVAWYRKNRPDVIRGQLSQDFSKDEKYKGKFVMWLLGNLLTNCWARPDFVAYNYEHAKKLSRRLCCKMGAVAVAYTVKSQEAYEKVRNQFELFIFDSFRLQ